MLPRLLIKYIIKQFGGGQRTNQVVNMSTINNKVAINNRFIVHTSIPNCNCEISCKYVY